jgi:hypothetical protein
MGCWASGRGSGALGARVEQREEFGQLDQPCGRLPLGDGEGLTVILAVEQILEPRLHRRSASLPLTFSLGTSKLLAQDVD